MPQSVHSNLIDCPYGCKSRVSVSDVAEHLNYCVSVRDCEYAQYGCTIRVPRKNYESHLRDYSQYHLNLITPIMKQTNSTPSAPPLEFMELTNTTSIPASVPLAPSPIAVNNINYKTAINALSNQVSQLFSTTPTTSPQPSDIVKQVFEVFEALFREFANSPSISPPVRWIIGIVVAFILKDLLFFLLRLVSLMFVGFTTFRYLASTPYLDDSQTKTKALVAYVVFMCYLSMLIL